MLRDGVPAPVTVLLAVVALVASGVAVVQTRSAQRAEQRAVELEGRLAEAHDRIDRLEEDLEEARRDDPLEGLLEGLLGGGGGLGDLLRGGGLDDLLEGLGDGEGLGDLFGGGAGGDLFGGDLLGRLSGCLGDVGTGSLGGLLSDPDAPADEDRAATVERIAGQVEELRELSFEEPPEVTFSTSEEVEQRVRELFLDAYSAEDADTEGRVLAALGAVPPASDLRELRLSALTGQVAGFYVPRTDELVVRSDADGEPLGAADRMALAHELEHALADQVLGLPVDERVPAGEEDDALAALAVVEGDATLTMQRWSLTHVGIAEQFALLGDPAVAAARAQLDELPPYLADELVFPYTEGLAFVCDRYGDGGWDTVDALYATPPASSAEVLFPERDRTAPDDPRDPAAPGAPWRHTAVRDLGAAHLLWLFEAPAGDRDRGLDGARELVSRWDGGEAHLYTDGERSAVGVALAADGDRLCDAVVDWYGAAFPEASVQDVDGDERLAADGPDRDAVVACPSGEVRVGIAPDLSTARTLAR